MSVANSKDESEVRDVDLEQFIYDKSDVDYIEVDGELLDIQAHLRAGENLIQYGPQGIGKTLSFASVGAELGIPVLMFPCSKETKRSHLVVRPWMEVEDGEKKTVYIPGYLPLAIRAANEYGKAILVMEEVNALTPHMQKMLNELGDWREEVNVSEAGEKFVLEDDAQLLIGATMNPSHKSRFGGTFDLNDDLRDRFSELSRDFPESEKFDDILRAHKVPESIGNRSGVLKDLRTFSEEVHKMFMQDEVDYDMSPRSTVRLGDMWQHYYDIIKKQSTERENAANEALRRALVPCVLDKYYDAEQKESVNDEAKTVFGVKSRL